jgi:hypothetical protein
MKQAKYIILKSWHKIGGVPVPEPNTILLLGFETVS